MPSALAKVPYRGGAATGGIIRGHSLLQVAERGPEAIIPLSGGRRAEGLLHYASKAIGMGGITNHHGGPVTFTTNVTINGNASEREVGMIKSAVRDENGKFLSRFKLAQSQERRLSYQSPS